MGGEGRVVKNIAENELVIVEGKVVAVGEQMNKVAAEAFQKTGKAVMYVACVSKVETV